MAISFEIFHLVLKFYLPLNLQIEVVFPLSPSSVCKLLFWHFHEKPENILRAFFFSLALTLAVGIDRRGEKISSAHAMFDIFVALLFFCAFFCILLQPVLLFHVFSLSSKHFFSVPCFLSITAFWAAAPKGPMTYAFTHTGDFLLLLLLLHHPLTPASKPKGSRLQSQPKGSNLSLKAPTPTSRLQSQPGSSNPDYIAPISTIYLHS